jgi:transcriptional regulator with XRE-family HTH domain
MNFAERLRTLRQQHGVTTFKLGDVLGLNSTTITKWENGAFPSERTLNKLCDFFGVSMDYLLGRSDVKITVMREARWAEIAVVENTKPYKGKVIRFQDIPKDSIGKDKETDYLITSPYDDAMYPIIEKNDTVLIKKQSIANSGEYIFFTVNVSEGMIRKFVQKDNGIELHAINPYYAVKKIDDISKLKILGVVKQSTKKF